MRLVSSASGTNRTSSDVRLESAIGSKAEYICSRRVFPGLTHSGHLSSALVLSGKGLSDFMRVVDEEPRDRAERPRL
jgi:hypothetical protein